MPHPRAPGAALPPFGIRGDNPQPCCSLLSHAEGSGQDRPFRPSFTRASQKPDERNPKQLLLLRLLGLGWGNWKF